MPPTPRNYRQNPPLILVILFCLFPPAWILGLILELFRPMADPRINDPVWDHRDHLGACCQHPRVGQGQGNGLI